MKLLNKGKLIVTLFTIFISFQTKAQDIINEDFLDNIESNANSLWAENAPAFAVNQIPEKYKNESAVIIGYKRSVTIDKKSRMGFLSRGERSLLFYENIRFKIKLNDKNAVNNFTEIYFRYNDKLDGFSVKITKPDGLTKQISLNDAVQVESSGSVPEFFKSFFDNQYETQKRYYKVAISDLEPGDILEYVTVTKSKLDVSYSGYIEFSPQYELCNKVYPILYNQINIETDEKSFFKSLSLNGAPDFKKEPSTDNEFFRYSFTDKDRGVEKDVNFINTYKVLPFTKFQVIYANNEKIKGALIGEKGEIKKAFSKEELAKKAWEDYVEVGNMYYGSGMTVQKVIDELWLELKKNGAKNDNDNDYINNVYYRIRNLVVFRDTYLSDKVAAYIFGSLLFQKDIKSDLIISVSNSIGTLKDVLFDQEIKYVVRVNNKLYYNLTDHTNPGEMVQHLLGSESYIIAEPAKKTGEQSIIPFTLPDATAAENKSDYTINASLESDLNTLNVSRTSTITGISKANVISDVLKNTPYIFNDYKYYHGVDPTDKMRGKELDIYETKVRAIKEEFAKSKKEKEKSELQHEFGQKIKFNNFSVISDGRSLKNQTLVYAEDFELPGMLRKAGKKLLVNLTGLMGGQLQIKKEERIRKNDINVGFAKTISWTINFKIPDGYTVDGLKELNTDIDNETGSYSCKAEEQNGTVILKINKVYKKANISKEKWNDMLSFIDAAYNNSFRYILLTPKN